MEQLRNGDVGNMCNSFERVLNDVREEGREEGREEEREYLVMKCYQKGKTPEVIAEFMDIPLEKVEKIISENFAGEKTDVE